MNFSPVRTQLETKPAKKTKLPKLLSVVVIVLLVLQVIVSNRLATSGLELNEIEGKIQEVSEENTDLRQKVASLSALQVVEEKAAGLGFVQPIEPVYLTREPSVAFDLK